MATLEARKEVIKMATFRPVATLLDRGNAKTRKSKKHREAETPTKMFTHKNPAAELTAYFQRRSTQKGGD